MHTVEARISDLFTRGEDRELFETEVNPDGGTRFRERVNILLDEDGDEEVSRSLTPDRHIDNSSQRNPCVFYLHEPEFWETDFVAFDPNINRLSILCNNFRRVRLNGIRLLLELRLLILSRKEAFVAVIEVFEGCLQRDTVHIFKKTRSLSVSELREHRRTFAVRHSLARLLVGVLREREEVVVDESGASERFDNQFLLFLRRIDTIPICFVGEHADTSFQPFSFGLSTNFYFKTNSFFLLRPNILANLSLGVFAHRCDEIGRIPEVSLPKILFQIGKLFEQSPC